MSGLNHKIRIRSTYTRSINLQRDSNNLNLISAYLPTSRAIQALEQISEGLTQDAKDRSLALIGPYGSGKSAFALFLSALLASEQDSAHQAAIVTLKSSACHILPHFQRFLAGNRGFLRVSINGIPASLVRQLLLALAVAVEQHSLNKKLSKKLYAAAQADTPMDCVLTLIGDIQTAWAKAGGSGVLIEIDELGKFLEYESFHPQQREMHLLQLLAEYAQQSHAAPLHLVVILHQAFEYYTNRLGKHLREEWQKVQGRFSTIAFLEPAEQALRVVSAAFENSCVLSSTTKTNINVWAKKLAVEGALAYGMDETYARTLFERCYPLHPLTLLILPVLCQKVAQNERTLFSYLSSKEPFGFLQRLEQISLNDWIAPWELYDYFILNQAGGFSDPLTYHRWMEVVAALERFDAGPDDAAVHLLKTIGLLNLIGGQRGLKASPVLLQQLFGVEINKLISQLESVSIIHFRNYSQEYRVWQGSDFDMNDSLQQTVAEYDNLPLAETLNKLAPLKPIVARRASIISGSLRCFIPHFTDRNFSRSADVSKTELRLWFYLAEENEKDFCPKGTPKHDVVAICHFTERLREAIIHAMALKELPKRYAILHQDPIALHEYHVWLVNAENETKQLFRSLLDKPEALRWYWGGKEQPIKSRYDLQQRLSKWVQNHCYPQTPLIRNELINWDHPSVNANTARKRLFIAMLTAADQPNLGIEKTPAEMSLYFSLLKTSRLHRQENGRWGFYLPDKDDDPCALQPLWKAISKQLGTGGERQVPVSEIYELLRRHPYGVKLGVLPVLLVAYLLIYRREVAFYQEGIFCEDLAMEKIEMLCRRPELFALERFDLGGLRGDLFDRYISSVVGKVQEDATLLDIVRPLMRFISNLPQYSMQCKGLSREAERVRKTFLHAKSPGTLLFDTLPKACGMPSGLFVDGDIAVIESFIQRLVQVLRELKGAYGILLLHWQRALNQALLDEKIPDLCLFRQALAKRYHGLDRYTPDRMGLAALIRRLCDTGYESDQAWLESTATLLGRMPPQKWGEENRLQAELRLNECGEQVRDLEKLRMAVPDESSIQGTLLVKMVDAEQGEISKVIQLSSTQRASAMENADKIVQSLVGLGELEKLAVVAALFEKMSKGYGNGHKL